MKDWNVSAGSIEELIAAFGNVGTFVAHKKSRDKFEMETWVLRRCLFAIAAEGLVEFPLLLRRAGLRGQPDFWIHEGHKQPAALEVTEATSSDDARERSLLRSKGGSILLGALGGRGQGGFDGLEPESMCALDIVESVRRKLSKPYAQIGMKLCVYVNSNPGFVAKAERIASKLFASNAFDLGGASVHVLHEQNVIANAFTSNQSILPFPVS